MKFVLGLVLCSFAVAAVFADDSESSEEEPQVRILGVVGDKVVEVIEKVGNFISGLKPTTGADYSDFDYEVIDTENATVDNDEKGY
ncbi:hypothetical protein GE061_009466 [Apolygus lucorum]|uniref:Uncharacterized protein n=1 Tax=Apolygus lucorum TaxID=248454 RepID=A0A8S9Y0L5_APOLU|nr:hypothetical protein GE061_009466 [Apolygus lucorum]